MMKSREAVLSQTVTKSLRSDLKSAHARLHSRKHSKIRKMDKTSVRKIQGSVLAGFASFFQAQASPGKRTLWC